MVSSHSAQSIVINTLFYNYNYCRIYLCCGKHRDLVFKRYEPEPQPPQRPLRVTITGGVVTIDSGSINEFNDDEVSLQPSIAPITRKPTVRYNYSNNNLLLFIIILHCRKHKLFTSQPDLLHNQNIGQSLNRMMESEPASHYQLSIDETDELIVEGGMFELESYDTEPRLPGEYEKKYSTKYLPVNFNTVPDVHSSNNGPNEETNSSSPNILAEDTFTEMEKDQYLRPLFSSSPAVLDEIDTVSQNPKIMQSESRDADLELDSSDDSLTKKQNLKSRDSIDKEEHPNSLSSSSKEVTDKIENIAADRKEFNDDDNGRNHPEIIFAADRASVSDNSDEKPKDETTQTIIEEVTINMTNEADTNDKQQFQIIDAQPKISEEFKNKDSEVCNEDQQQQVFDKEKSEMNTETQQQTEIYDGKESIHNSDDEETNETNTEDMEMIDKYGIGKEGVPCEIIDEQATAMTKYDPLSYPNQKIVQSGFDGSESESSSDEYQSSNGTTQKKEDVEILNAGAPNINQSGNGQKQSNRNSLSSLATISYKAEPLTTSSLASISDNDSEIEIVATSKVQTPMPKQAMIVRNIDNDEDHNGITQVYIQKTEQSMRKRKVTPAIPDMAKLYSMQQTLAKLNQIGGGSQMRSSDLSLGSIAEEGGFKEEDEEDLEDDSENEGHTKF